MNLLAVAAGGALGACLRAAIFQSFGRWGITRFPHALYTVNVMGSLLLGVTAGAAITRWPAAHAFLAGGFCGALTTFSTFSVECVELLRSRGPVACLVHVAVNLGGSVLGVGVGAGIVDLVDSLIG